MLNQLHADLWEINAPLRVLGMHLGHRMTIARLPDGTLWLHSPVAYSEALAAELRALGPVGHIVAPNYMHDTFLEGWVPRYPEARFHAPRAFAKVFRDYPATDVLGPQAPAAWSDVIDQHVVQGARRLHEVVFLHRPSRSLIVADLAFNLGSEMPLLSRTLLRLNGCYCRFAPSRMVKAVIDDRAALRRSIEHLLGWDFARIIVGHGDNLTSSPKEALREAFAFL
jgi:hypothetical protein